MTRLILSVGTALLLTVGTVWASPLEDATAAYARGDYAAALKIYQPLAAQGNADAQNNLGMLYRDGQGVPQDYTQARQWYEKAAAQGLAQAKSNLGVLYRNGQSVPQDYVWAYMWFNLATEGSTGDLQKSAAHNRDKVARRMTPAQIAEAQRLAQQCHAQQFKGC